MLLAASFFHFYLVSVCIVLFFEILEHVSYLDENYANSLHSVKIVYDSENDIHRLLIAKTYGIMFFTHEDSNTFYIVESTEDVVQPIFDKCIEFSSKPIMIVLKRNDPWKCIWNGKERMSTDLLYP